MYRRVVFAAAHSTSFDDASEAMQELAELPLLPKRIWRAAKRVGEERIAECQAAAEAYEQLPLPARQSGRASAARGLRANGRRAVSSPRARARIC